MGVDNFEKSSTTLNDGVTNFAAGEAFVKEGPVLVVEEVVHDQFSAENVAVVVDEMMPMAATANNIILIWLSDGGKVHLGFGRFAMKKMVFDASQNG